MIIPLNPQIAKPIYLQIADHITALARSGHITAQQRLPSSRQLAEQLQVHRSTIVNAYDELRARGVIEAIHGSGSYIVDGVADPAYAAPPAATLLPPSVIHREQLLTQIWRLNHAEGIVSLALAIPAEELLPHAAMERVRQRVLRRDGHKLHTYVDPQGFAPLRRAITLYLAYHGIQAEADDVVVTCGGQEALALAMRALAMPGDTGLVECPAFFGTWLGMERAGLTVQPFAIDTDGPDWDDLVAAYRATGSHPRFIIVSPDFQNPTGVRWNASERHRFLHWAADQGLAVLEDATYRDLGVEGHPFVPLRALDPSVLYIGSFSKSLMPGLRIGFIVASGLLRDQLVTLKTITSGSNESTSQFVLTEYLVSGGYGDHCEDMTAAYRRRRDAVLEAMERYFPAEASWSKPAGGFSIWVSLPPHLPAAALFHHALAQGILIAPADVFVPSGAVPNAFRVCFARYGETVLTGAIRALGRLLHTQGG